MSAMRFVLWLSCAAAFVCGTAAASGLNGSPAPKRSPAKPATFQAPGPTLEEDAAQKLRERLAQRLGQQTPPAEPRHGVGVVRVTTRDSAPPPAARAKPRAPATSAHATHWSYSGEAGPKAWGGLRPEFALCGNGTRQSPIDIRAGFSVDLEPVSFDYKASPFRVIDNGHTLQVNIEPGNFIVVAGQRFELQQFHFHHPAEERVDGKTFDMSLHLVHRSAEGRLAVVALLLERGEGPEALQPVVQTVWNNLPLEKNEEFTTRAALDLNHLLPPDRRYYTYMGSLTTPPCTEGVRWVVMRQPVVVAPAQVALFARIYPMNARPVQAAQGRTIKQSN